MQADKNKKDLADNIQKIESILQGEDKLPILSSVPEFIISLDFKNLEELNSIEQDIKTTRYIFAKLLANKKQTQKAEAQARNKELTEQLSKDHPYLFEQAIDEDGNPIVVDGKNVEVLKSQNQLGAEKGSLLEAQK